MLHYFFCLYRLIFVHSFGLPEELLFIQKVHFAPGSSWDFRGLGPPDIFFTLLLASPFYCRPAPLHRVFCSFTIDTCQGFSIWSWLSRRIPGSLGVRFSLPMGGLTIRTQDYWYRGYQSSTKLAFSFQDTVSVWTVVQIWIFLLLYIDQLLYPLQDFSSWVTPPLDHYRPIDLTIDNYWFTF